MTAVTPKITVLMPAYNAEKYIGEAISSILNQTFTDFEFLIINDGSTDETEIEIRKYKDDRIKLVNNSNNLGLITALNKGLELAKGKYIARMDADDISLPERLILQFEFMENNNSVVACGAWTRMFGGSRPRYFNLNKNNSEETQAMMFIDPPLSHPTSIIRKSALRENNIQYDTRYLHCEDYKLWFDLSKIGKLANIHKILLRYRLSSEQTHCVYADAVANSTKILRREIITDYFSQTKLHEKLPAIITREYLDYFRKNRVNLLKNGADKETEKKLNSILYCLYMSIPESGFSALMKYLGSFDYLNSIFWGKNGLKVLARCLNFKKYESLL